MYALKYNRDAEWDFSSFKIDKYQEYAAKSQSDITVFQMKHKVFFFKGYLFLKVYVHDNVTSTQVTQVR